MAIAIRIAGAGDVAALASLRPRWTDEQYGESGDPGFEERFAAWCAEETGRRVTWVAEVGGEPVGMVNLAIFERMPKPGRPASQWGYLGNAFVLAPYRNRGVGRQLMTALLDYADRNRLVRVVLSPSARSVPLYQRLGFGPAEMLLARRLVR